MKQLHVYAYVQKQNSDIRELITESRFYLHKIMDITYI